ncbi:glycerate kinase [Sediminihabitans luteus]|uniref:Glycerate kinase n=1 Tax=Sediminihabitans luteus TaxID=1138585 RepID=A0A2M9CQ32_9CELL|nr:glycerate kinase [Sediminihabitans luteus]PJJ74036.1 glycerate kinase [Sediminihabitans luteus]GII98049.1 hypothetical protein Slu03_04270 [Sediminihabitans luteus]
MATARVLVLSSTDAGTTRSREGATGPATGPAHDAGGAAQDFGTAADAVARAWSAAEPHAVVTRRTLDVHDPVLRAALRAAEPPTEVVAATSSGAAGRAVLDAVRDGARRVVVPLADVTTHDGGHGFLTALLGDAPADERAPADEPVPADALVRAARAALRGVDLVALVHDDLPLLGLHGATATRADRGQDVGGDPQQVERSLSALADDLARGVHDVAGDLLAGSDARSTFRRLTSTPGAGDGGGLGFGMLVAGGRLVDAARWAGAATDLDAAISGVDLVVVVREVLDGTALHGGEVPDAVRRAGPLGVPVVVLAADVRVGRRETGAAGLAGAYALEDSDAHVRRIARTWTPAR